MAQLLAGFAPIEADVDGIRITGRHVFAAADSTSHTSATPPPSRRAARTTATAAALSRFLR
jgi:hypothetical protein